MMVPSSELTDADQRYLARVAEDCRDLLGPEIELDGIDLQGGAGVVLRLRYRLGKTRRVTEGHGTTVIEAHADLRKGLVLDRIRIATSAVYRQHR